MTGPWRTILAAAATEVSAFETALAQPATAQEMLLRQIVTANAQTRIGKEHGFAGIKTIAEYQASVPVRSYAGFAPWIEAAVAGEPNVLTAAPVIAFEETGGSTGGAKLIPYTRASLAAFRSAVLPALHHLVRRRPAITGGTLYAAISPATRQPRRTPGGIAIGLASDAAYLGEDLIAPFLQLLAVAPAVGQIADTDAWRSETLRQLRQRQDLSLVSVWSPTFWLQLTEGLTADETQALWPQLDTISCWMDSSSSLFIGELRRRFPHAHCEPKGLLSTETPVTLPYGDSPDCVPALRSAFLEFRDRAGAIHLCHRLSPGADYDVIATTPGGLYRYDTGDRVHCRGTRQGVPGLVFAGRGAGTSDMVGEKLEEGFVASILAGLPVAARLVARSAPPHYEVWLDAPSHESSENWLREVEAGLLRNPQYDYARRMHQLGPLAARFKPGFWRDFTKVDKRLAVIKPAAMQPWSESSDRPIREMDDR